MQFEEVADTIDTEDNQRGGADDDSRLALLYLAQMKGSITMSPLMTKVASEADFIQCDITQL